MLHRIKLKLHPNAISIGSVVVLGLCSFTNQGLSIVGNTKNKATVTNYSPRMAAFLATIRWAETGNSGYESYRKLVFNGTFNDFSTHPRIRQCALINARNVCSTAAGAYQMLDISWNDLQPDLGLKDFSPPSQDKMAIEYIRRNKAIDDVESGNVEMAFCKVGKVWASLICNDYNQNPRTIEELKNYYNKQLIQIQGRYGNSN
jgi:muramidase (phage lysozyme)